MRTRLTTATLILSLISLAGCTATPAVPAATVPQGTNQPTVTVTAPPAVTTVTVSAPAPATSETPTAAPTPTPTQEAGTAPFGSAYTWDDGISIFVGKPSPFRPSDISYGTSRYTQFVVMDIKLVNKSGRAWDPGSVYASAQSGNREADHVSDVKLPNSPKTKLLNGREAVYKIAFGVADLNDVVLEIRPDFAHESVLFKTAGGTPAAPQPGAGTVTADSATCQGATECTSSMAFLRRFESLDLPKTMQRDDLTNWWTNPASYYGRDGMSPTQLWAEINAPSKRTFGLMTLKSFVRVGDRVQLDVSVPWQDKEGSSSGAALVRYQLAQGGPNGYRIASVNDV